MSKRDASLVNTDLALGSTRRRINTREIHFDLRFAKATIAKFLTLIALGAVPLPAQWINYPTPGIPPLHPNPGRAFAMPRSSAHDVRGRHPRAPGCRAGPRARTVSRSMCGRRQQPAAADSLSWCGSTVEDSRPGQRRCLAPKGRIWLVVEWSS
jgi:hypothetical protein